MHFTKESMQIATSIHMYIKYQWFSFVQPEEAIKEDFLFPMNNRLSYASSPESDYEGWQQRPHSLYDEQDDMADVGKPQMVRSSSDPSINTQDAIPGIPPYPAPPSYNRGYRQHPPVGIKLIF